MGVEVAPVDPTVVVLVGMLEVGVGVCELVGVEISGVLDAVGVSGGLFSLAKSVELAAAKVLESAAESEAAAKLEIAAELEAAATYVLEGWLPPPAGTQAGQEHPLGMATRQKQPAWQYQLSSAPEHGTLGAAGEGHVTVVG